VIRLNNKDTDKLTKVIIRALGEDVKTISRVVGRDHDDTVFALTVIAQLMCIGKLILKEEL